MHKSELTILSYRLEIEKLYLKTDVENYRDIYSTIDRENDFQSIHVIREEDEVDVGVLSQSLPHLLIEFDVNVLKKITYYLGESYYTNAMAAKIKKILLEKNFDMFTNVDIDIIKYGQQYHVVFKYSQLNKYCNHNLKRENMLSHLPIVMMENKKYLFLPKYYCWRCTQHELTEQ